MRNVVSLVSPRPKARVTHPQTSSNLIAESTRSMIVFSMEVQGSTGGGNLIKPTWTEM
jgi:hypothetical protein